MEPIKVLKSNQEQAVATWIGYLNQLRIDTLLESLHEQDLNLEAAIGEMDRAIESIHVDVIDANLGAGKGMHGWIAEVAEVGISNARRLVVGDEPNMEWAGRGFGPIDIIRDGVENIQVKFYGSWGGGSLLAAAKHLEKYPDFLEQHGKYQIPKDQYDTIKRLLEMPQDEAGLLARSAGGPSFTDWKFVQEFFSEGGMRIEDFEPASLNYNEVQRGTIDAAMETEKVHLREKDQGIRDQAHQDSLPSLREGAKATVAAAVIEGGTAFVMAVSAKRKEGKALSEFDEDDWREILGEAGQGFGKGGVRGASIYFLTNFTATSAAVASALVTASFGIAEQAHRLREGEIEEIEFIDNAEMLCLDASVSALSSFIGQALIPVPVLGAVIGNTVGTVMYQAAKDNLSAREQAIIEAYAKEQRELDERLEAEYGSLIDSLNVGMAAYFALLDRAFDPNPALAFEGSIALALQLGVPSEQVLDTREKARAFFVD